MPRAVRARTVDWDWNAFLHDGRVEDMDALTLGAWTRILGAFALAETPGTLPISEETLRAIARLNETDWAHARALLLQCMITLEPRGYRHERTARDHAAQTKRVKDARARKTHAANVRWGKEKDADASQVHEVQPAMHVQSTRNACEMPPSLLSLDSKSESKTESKAHAAPKAPAPNGAHASHPIGSLLPDIAKMCEPHGPNVTRECIAICTRLAKSGMMHRGLLLEIVRHFLDNRHKVSNAYAYYSPGGSGFQALKLRLAADSSFAEHEAIKAAELAWRRA